MKKTRKTSAVTRRGFLGGLAGLGGAALVPIPAASGKDEPPAPAGRLEQAYTVRLEAARQARRLGAPEHRVNGDEEALPGRIACYSKGLPHDRLGEVDARAYRLLLRALDSGNPEQFESIPLGGYARLANPQAAWAFDLVGPDCSQVEIAPPPTFAGAEQAAEMAELYWQALLRDVPFTAWDDHPMIRKAAEDLSRLAGYRGRRQEGAVTPATLFRGDTPGDLTGPYLSQFLWKEVPFSPVRLEQRIRTAVPGLDYLTAYDEWLAVCNGALAGVNRFEAKPLYIRNGRDLAEYVHRDFTYQAFLGACLTALKLGTPPDGGNPYKHLRTQAGFTTFGQPFLLYLLAVVTQVTLKACWFHKWRVHRRLRPEELGGRVENHLRGAASYPLHSDLLGSGSVEEVRRRHRSALLPQAYPEGCPLHPSYPAGHAAIAGACATVLKACLDESHEIPEPVVASPDGLSLLPYTGPALTVGGELDKLAANIALGRGFAGVHWRSDSIDGLGLGEAVAIQVLTEVKLTHKEMFAGFSFRRFDGRRVSV